MENPAFFGEKESRTVSEVLATLTDLTGSVECALQFLRVCDEIEAECSPQTAFSRMSSEGWVN